MTDFIKKTGLGAGTGVKYGGTEIDKWDNTFNDVDTGVTAKINIPFIFRDDRLKFYDSSGSSRIITVSTPSLAADRQISIPIITSNVTWAFLETLKNLQSDYYIFNSSGTYYAVNNTTNTMTSNSVFETLLSSIIATAKHIELGSGDFGPVSSQLVLTTSNIKINGQGVDITRVLFDTGATGASFVVQGSVTSAGVLTANSLRGVKTLAVNSGHGIVANDWIYIKCTRQVQKAGNNGADAEIHQVKSVTSTQLTLKDYLYADYTTALTSTVYKINFCTNFQLEDLTLIDTRSTPKTALTEQADCLFNLCYNLHIDNVKFENMYFASAGFQNCYNVNIPSIYFESPKFINKSDAYWINYGGIIYSATTNFSCTGGWGNNARHIWTTDIIAGQTAGNGRQRNISISNFNAYNSNLAAFDNHEGAVGMVYSNCHAQGGYHQVVGDYVYSPNSQQTDQGRGYGCRSPTTFIGCVAENCENYGFAIYNDDDSTSSGDDQPGGDGTSIINCRILNTQTGDGTSVGVNRGVRVLPNRKDITIKGNYFFNIKEEPILVGDGCNNVIIEGNTFHTCGASLSSSRGLIRCLGNHDDFLITGNIFGGGTPPGSARPLEFATSVDRLVFKDNDVNGLTNKTPSLPAASTGVIIGDNPGLNPIGKITNPCNTSTNTLGLYGGTTSTVVASTDYTIVGSMVLITCTGGNPTNILTKDNLGNTITSGDSSLTPRTLPQGYKVNFGAFSSAPTVGIYAW